MVRFWSKEVREVEDKGQRVVFLQGEFFKPDLFPDMSSGFRFFKNHTGKVAVYADNAVDPLLKPVYEVSDFKELLRKYRVEGVTRKYQFVDLDGKLVYEETL